MSDKKKGRKPLSDKEKQEYQKWQNERVKIRNLVSRAKDSDIDQSCCICGNRGNILHNRQDPYYIAFICHECRKDPNNLIIAEESRQDIREKLNMTNLSYSNFTDAQVIRLVTGYMNERLTLGEYCEKTGVSRHQFNLLIRRYDELCPDNDIVLLVKKHTKSVQRERCAKVINERTFNA